MIVGLILVIIAIMYYDPKLIFLSLLLCIPIVYLLDQNRVND